MRVATLLVGLALATPVSGADRETTLTVFAAASLAEAFIEIGRDLEQEHPGLRVRFNFAGSQQLAAQIEQGAPADVFASADDRWMSYAQERGLVASQPQAFVRNRLIVIVPKTNPARIARLSDLARRGVKLVLGAEAVPVGKYSREMLHNLSRLPGFGDEFPRRVLANVVSEEENVRGVVGKVQLGEADAGIVYRSDISPSVARFVRTFEIPESANMVARYPIAVLKGSRRPEEGGAFVAKVLSAEGQQTLERHGFLPATTPRP